MRTKLVSWIAIFIRNNIMYNVVFVSLGINLTNSVCLIFTFSLLQLEIAGIPFTEGENTNAIVTEVAELLDVKITDKDISTSHRLRSRNDNRPPPIIARFISRDVRNELYSKRKLTQGINLDQLSVKGISELYINENLTPFRKRLFWKAKQDAIKANYKFFWTVNGNIFVRKTENSKPLLITTEQDLNLIK